MKPESFNNFSIAYYENLIRKARKSGYKFVTLAKFIELGCPEQLHFVIRHDLDKQPNTLQHIIESEAKLGVPSTTFVRLAGADYNFLSYGCFKTLKMIEENGSEIGLHSNFVEFATINDLEPSDVLRGELASLRAFFSVNGIACHRDINYIHNSLPYLEKHWKTISSELDLDYQAYDAGILSRACYVNEGLNPHLCWRNPPEPAIETGRSIYMLTHSHWWFKDHPFEAS